MGKKVKNNKKFSKNSRVQLRSRLTLISAILLLYGAVLVSRLFYLQILDHEKLEEKSKQQHLTNYKINYGRGLIFDRNQNELAMNIDLQSIAINPHKIINKKKTAKILATTLQLDKGKIYQKTLSSKKFLWIKRKCDLSAIRNLKKLNLPGVNFIREQKRYYPKRELAANLIGFVGLDNQGLGGIEYHRRNLLDGNIVENVMRKDGRNRVIYSPGLYDNSENHSYNLVLTIDEVIQHLTEFHLAEQIEKYQAKSGMAVVMDPYSGEIYALANIPQFNPNNFSVYPPERRKNNVVSSSYEPGSIFKPIVAAAAMDLGEAGPDSPFYCEDGIYRVGRTLIREAASHKFGWLSLKKIIAQSSNIGAIKIAQRLGPKNFYHYIRKFGFGQKLGIDLPAEAVGQLKGLDRWSDVSLSSISFGQEIAVTPLQMVSALSAIANGGNLMQPRITKAIFKNGKLVESLKPKIIRRVISEKTSRIMIDILKEVVQSGTGAPAAIPGFEVAGKTGTAQKYDFKAQRYSSTDFLSSFIGFAPANSPKIVVLVMIDNPKKSYWGSVVAAPVFRELTRDILRHMNIPTKDERVYFLRDA